MIEPSLSKHDGIANPPGTRAAQPLLSGSSIISYSSFLHILQSRFLKTAAPQFKVSSLSEARHCFTTLLLIYTRAKNIKAPGSSCISCIKVILESYEELWTLWSSSLGLNVKNRTFPIPPEPFNISYYLTRSLSCETFFPSRKCQKEK